MENIVIIALDFDGVLHKYEASEWVGEREEYKFFHYLPRFEAVVRDYPQVRIVIASSWRLQKKLDALRAIFSEDIGKKILGVTPIHQSRSMAGLRQSEVESWLVENNFSGVRWVALDDESRNYLPEASLIVCNDGFSDFEEKSLRDFLDSTE